MRQEVLWIIFAILMFVLGFIVAMAAIGPWFINSHSDNYKQINITGIAFVRDIMAVILFPICINAINEGLIFKILLFFVFIVYIYFFWFDYRISTNINDIPKSSKIFTLIKAIALILMGIGLCTVIAIIDLFCSRINILQ